MKSCRALLGTLKNFTFIFGRYYQHQFRTPAVVPSYPVRKQLSELESQDQNKNYYRVLGLERCASLSQIKNAYYNMAKVYHPDQINRSTPEEEKHFADILEAYQILCDDSKRNEYDRTGFVSDMVTHTKRISERTPGDYQQLSRSKYGKIWQKIQSKKTDNRTQVMPSNHFQGVESSITVDFIDACLGLKKDFTIKCLKKCPKCKGHSSPIIKNELEMCKRCNGKGSHTITTKTFTSERTCEFCKGKKVIMRNICKLCENKGFLLQNQSIYMVVPAGIKSGEILKIRNPNDNVPNKLIAVKVNVSKSKDFERKGYDIHSDLNISIPQAILGLRLKVPTIYGPVELKVPPGIESHTKITLPGKGLRLPEATGDHIITVKIEIPKFINDQLRTLLNQWSKKDIKEYH